jgi:hypothetical protein
VAPPVAFALAVLLHVPMMRKLIRQEWAVEDDVRITAFWAIRHTDPGVFRRDPIAAYNEDVVPIGYRLLIEVPARLGVDPILLSNVLLVVLGLVAALLGYRLATLLRPTPLAGLLGSVVVTGSYLVSPSATPRGFGYVLLTGYLIALLERRTWLMAALLAAAALIYAPVAGVCLGTTLLVVMRRWRGWRRDELVRVAAMSAMCAALLLLTALAFNAGTWGPVVTRERGQSMIEFGQTGRAAFFFDLWQDRWLFGQHSGLFQTMLPLTIIGAALLPPLLVRRSSARGTTARPLDFLAAMVAVAVAGWAIAHVFWLKLYMPARFTTVPFRLAAAIATALLFTIVIERLFSPTRSRRLLRVARWTALAGTTAVFAYGALAYPLIRATGAHVIAVGEDGALYDALRATPKESLVASLSPQAGFIPAFAHRSVLTGQEYAVPFHLGYYRTFKRRQMALVDAHYTQAPSVLRTFLRRYGVDYFMIEAGAFEERYIAMTPYLHQYEPATSRALASLRAGPPVLQRLASRCAVLRSSHRMLVAAACVAAEL